MRFAAAIVMVLTLGACAEVTKFQRPDGSAYYYVDCENSMRLFESCSFAARRTCPGGYTQLPITPKTHSNDDRRYAQCIEANNDRREEGQPLLECKPTRRNEGYFACKE